MSIIGPLILLSLLAFVGYYLYIMLQYWFKQGYGEKKMIPIKQNFQSQSIQKASQTVVPSKDASIPNDTEKGKNFEAFIVQRFAKPYFQFMDWIGDKNVNGIYPLSNLNPDLLYEFRNGPLVIRFAVECK